MGIVDPEERDAALFGLLGRAAVGFNNRDIEPAYVPVMTVFDDRIPVARHR